MVMTKRVKYRGDIYEVLEASETLQAYKFKDAPNHLPRWVPMAECTDVNTPSAATAPPQSPTPYRFPAEKPRSSRPDSYEETA